MQGCFVPVVSFTSKSTCFFYKSRKHSFFSLFSVSTIHNVFRFNVLCPSSMSYGYKTVSLAEVELTVIDPPRGRSGSLLSVKGGSRSGTATMAVTNNGTLLIPRPPSGSRRGSVILIDGRRGSLVPVPGQPGVRRGSFVQFVSDDRTRFAYC